MKLRKQLLIEVAEILWAEHRLRVSECYVIDHGSNDFELILILLTQNYSLNLILVLIILKMRQHQTVYD